MDGIAFGCLTAMFLSHRRLSQASFRACGLAGAALLIFCLCFSIKGYEWGLGKTGLNFTLLAIGVCCVIAAASQSSWRSPKVLLPLVAIGRKSYEVYLTHMFAVLALFAAFVHFGKPMRGVPLLFLSAIVAAGLLGSIVSILYAEPMNRLIRQRTGTDRPFLGGATPEAD